MTIRRRLFISNILMIVLPALISMLAIGILSSVLMQALGISPDDYAHSGEDIDFFTDARKLASGWTEGGDAEEIMETLTDIVKEFPKSGASLVIYREGEAILTLGEPMEDEALTALLSQGGTHVYVLDALTVMTDEVGEYTLIGMREDRMSLAMADKTFRWRLLSVVIFTLAGVLGIVMLVNGLLTRLNFKHIMRPLSTLADGVAHIAEGNLAYRIHYGGRDEFAPVIADFNDMADRLQAMVAARQKDDESRRELIAGISHDLRTPLTSIIGYVEGLEQGVAATPAMQARYLSIIHEQADTLAHTINQLFLFTKLDTDSFPMRMEQVNLAEELRMFAELVTEGYAQKGLAVTLALPEADTLLVKADRVQLRNVLTNVLENSVKYGKKDGGTMAISLFALGRNAVVTLTDDGPGVPDASLEKLFSVFYRSDASRRNIKDGSGLGLAISARIIQRLGGAITAENVTPSGLSVRLTLPLIKEEKPHAEDTDH